MSSCGVRLARSMVLRQWGQMMIIPGFPEAPAIIRAHCRTVKQAVSLLDPPPQEQLGQVLSLNFRVASWSAFWVDPLKS